MKDISLAKTNAQGEYLYNKVQEIAHDEVFSKYMFYPKVSGIFKSHHSLYLKINSDGSGRRNLR